MREYFEIHLIIVTTNVTFGSTFSVTSLQIHYKGPNNTNRNRPTISVGSTLALPYHCYEQHQTDSLPHGQAVCNMLLRCTS